MSVLQRFLNPGQEKKKEEPIETCENVEDSQPHNPYGEILVLQHHSDIVRLLLRIGDKRFVSAGDDGKAVIWDVQHGKRIATLSGHSLPITSLILMPSVEGSTSIIVTGSSDKHIRMWDSETGRCLHEVTVPGTSVKCLLCINDEHFCAGGEFLSLWDRSGQLLHSRKNSASEDIQLMLGMKQDRIVVSADKELFVYQVDCDNNTQASSVLIQTKQLQSHREPIQSLVIVSNNSFASGSLDGMIILWHSSTFQPLKKLNVVMDFEGKSKRFPYSIQSLMCVQEKYLFAAVGCGFCAFDISSEQEQLIVRKQTAHLSKVTGVGFAYEGDFLVTCSEDSSLRLWGKKPSASQTSDYAYVITAMEKFTGLNKKALHSLSSSSPFRPTLLGECSAHGGCVQGFLDFDNEGIVSCGADGLVIIWKNAEMQKVRRNQAVRHMLFDSKQ